MKPLTDRDVPVRVETSKYLTWITQGSCNPAPLALSRLPKTRPGVRQATFDLLWSNPLNPSGTHSFSPSPRFLQPNPCAKLPRLFSSQSGCILQCSVPVCIQQIASPVSDPDRTDGRVRLGSLGAVVFMQEMTWRDFASVPTGRSVITCRVQH